MYCFVIIVVVFPLFPIWKKNLLILNSVSISSITWSCYYLRIFRKCCLFVCFSFVLLMRNKCENNDDCNLSTFYENISENPSHSCTLIKSTLCSIYIHSFIASDFIKFFLLSFCLNHFLFSLRKILISYYVRKFNRGFVFKWF